NTRYVKVQFYSSAYNSQVSGGNGNRGFKNVAITVPTVGTQGINYVQGGNSFGTMGILGLTDNNNLSIITNNTNRMMITNSGNVGIGTTTPSRSLEVTKGIATDSLSLVGIGSMLKFVKGTTGNSSLLMEFYKEGTSSSNYGVRSGYMGFGSGSTNDFFIMNQLSGKVGIGANNSEVITILSSGNVGIGTTTPTQKLSIGNLTLVAGVTPDAISLGGTYSSGAGQNLKLRLVESTTQAWGFGVSPNRLDYAVPTGSSHVFYINDAEQMRINTNGNVGIGIDNPAQKLDVNGTAKANNLILTNLATGAAADNILVIDGSNNVKKVAALTNTNIYNSDGTITGVTAGNRTVTMGNNN
ncbi:MAG: hypothetical protein ACRCUS_06255, partial [Anaerovoracaceae bacterium]